MNAGKMLALQQSLRATICESAALAHKLTKPFAERSVLCLIEAYASQNRVYVVAQAQHCAGTHCTFASLLPAARLDAA